MKSGEVTRRSEPPAEANTGDAGPADRAHSRPQLGASALAFAVLLALTPPGSGQAATADGIDPNDPAQVALGEALYAAQCASCHGTDLEGQRDWQRQRPDGTFPAPPHDETGHTWHHADALLFDYTKHGGAAVVGGNFASNMPGFGDLLTDDEIRAVIAYIKSTWPPPIRQRQEQRNAGG